VASSGNACHEVDRRGRGSATTSKRRCGGRGWCWRPALLLAGAAALLALTLPEHYRSSALVAALWDDADETLLRQPEVAKRRSQLVRQRLTERVLVEQVLRETRPYTRASGALPSAEEQMQRLLADLRVRPLTPSSYVVEYVHRDAQKAALVPNRLVAALEAQAPKRRRRPTRRCAGRGCASSSSAPRRSRRRPRLRTRSSSGWWGRSSADARARRRAASPSIATPR
jgi:hypothetical protein